MMNILSTKISNSFALCKCGEIFFRKNKEFLIYCSICEMVCSEFSEFLLHMQTIHFSDEMRDVNAKVNVNGIVNEIGNIMEEGEEIIIEKSTWDDLPDVQGKPDEVKRIINNGKTIDMDNPLEKEIQLDTGKCKEVKCYEVIEVLGEFAPRSSSQPFHEEFLPELNENIVDREENSCVHCKQRFNDSITLKKHMHECSNSTVDLKKDPHGKLLLLCHECDESFHNSRSFHRHCVQQHCGFKCSLCERRFKQLHQCKRHEQTHIASKTYTCSFQGCSKSFTEKYYLRRHQDVHNAERNFCCDFENCGKAFQTNRRLMAHRKIHTKPKNLICDICGYSCRENETLRVHQRIHTGERPYPCQICDKRFISSSSLGEHMATHASGRPHVCKVCNAAFARQKALYHHRFLHLDVKKFKCHICGSAYKQAAGLAGHMRKHRQERNRLTSSITTAIAATT